VSHVTLAEGATITSTVSTVAISAPFGQTTTITLDPNTGYATKIAFPDGTFVKPEHQSNGMLTALVDARKFRHYLNTIQLDASCEMKIRPTGIKLCLQQLES
jgi:hypothetical protein